MGGTRLRIAWVGVLAVLLATLPAVPAASQSGWTKQTISSANLNGVSFPTPERGWAVGSGGTVLRTADGGETWESQASGVSADLNAVDFVDEQRGWIVGEDATVLSTTDGGATWTRRSPGITGFIAGVDFVDADHGWAVGYDTVIHFIIRTEDGGQTWARQHTSAGLGLFTISFADRQRGFVAGNSGTAYRTEDGGETWLPMVPTIEPLKTVNGDTFRAAVRIGPDEGLMAGNRGDVIRTADGGPTWELVAELGKRVNGLAVAGDTAFAVGQQGLVARSTDRGLTWEIEASGTTTPLYAVSAPSPARAMGVGFDGLTVRFDATPLTVVPLVIGPWAESCDGLDRTWVRERTGPLAVAVALDATGDGSLEVAVAGTQGVRLLRPFTPTEEAVVWELPTQALAQKVAVADLDGDGRPELVVAFAASGSSRNGILALAADTGEVKWSRRMPDGSRGLRLADLDGDGLDDIVSWSDDHALSVLSGIDGHDLRPPKAVGSNIHDVRLADLLGDGTDDIVLALNNGRVVALEGRTGAPLWTHTVAQGTLRGLAVGDLTGDGGPDVVAAGRGQSETLTQRRAVGGLIRVLDGRDGSRLWDHVRGGNYHYHAVALADLTGDGVPDVVGQSAQFGSSQTVALADTGRVAAGTRLREPYPLWTYDTTRPGGTGTQSAFGADAITTGDVTGDGVPDVFVGLWSGGPFAVDGAVPDPPQIDPLAGVPEARGLWDGGDRGISRYPSLVEVDGEPLLLSLTDDALALHEGATGAIRWRYDVGSLPVTAAFDVTGDGHAEVVVGARTGRVHAVGTDGKVLSTEDVYLSHRVRTVTALDRPDGSGQDAVVGTADGMVVALDVITGDVRWSNDLGSEPLAAAVAGDVVAVGTAGGRAVALRAADGDVGWDRPQDAAVKAVAAAGDRVAVGTAAGVVRVLDRASGATVAEDDTGTAAQGGVNAMTVADLTGDGQPDLVTAIASAVYAHDLDANRYWEHGTANSVTAVTAGDRTGDGRADVAAVSWDERVHVVDGFTGTPVWSAPVGAPTGVAMADLTGDGRPEVVAASSGALGTPVVVKAFAADGTPLGSCNPRKPPHTLLAVDTASAGASVILGTAPGDLYRLDPSG